MPVLKFSVFELDQSSGELTRAGRRVAIGHQPFTVLWMLASRAGSVVTRDELKRVLWSDGTHVDFDRGLNFCIASVRRALGDVARVPRFVETVPKRGYRFIAEVTKADNAPPLVVATRLVRSRARHWASLAAVVYLAAQGPAVLGAHTRATALPQALAAFERGDYESAVRIDGRFAEAHYALARETVARGERNGAPGLAELERAKAAAGRAIALEDVAESRRLRGTLRLTLDWDFAGAGEDFRQALALAPRWDLGLSAYADYLSAAGNDWSALAVIAQAEVLSPSCDLLAFQSAVLHYRARDYATSLAKLTRARELGPPREIGRSQWDLQLHDLAFLINVRREDWPAARAEALALARLHPSEPARVRAWEALPAKDAVARFIDVSAEDARPSVLRGSLSSSRLALLNVLAGRFDEALGWLERAAARRESDLLFVLRDPAFDPVRSLPRFRRLAPSGAALALASGTE